ncbi:hypothetical protein [Halalkalibacterium ligniniphilum]|uniref:hypothetical protein n=1 Tax=Halalkalibacterium ligniniphilum TaxID=1134413 RepID=UPI00034A0879|nr:hypothetical protein [Halalkalibacterium ligniniphilum]
MVKSNTLIDVEDHVKRLLKEDDEYELCPYGLTLNNRNYYYGYITEKGYFVIDENGSLVTKNEALPILKDFVQTGSILTESLEHFQKCVTKRPLAAFEKLSFNLEKINKKYSTPFRGFEDDLMNIKHMLTVIFDGQEQLKEKITELQTFKKEKIQERLFLEKGDINQLTLLNSEMNWILYKQALSLDNTMHSMKKIHEFISNEFTFGEKYLNLTVMPFNKLLEQFISQETVEQNRESLKTFEENHNGKYIQFPEGEIGFSLFDKNINKKSEVNFDTYFAPKLINDRLLA